MLIFDIISQILSKILGIYILSYNRLTVKSLMPMLIVGLGLSYPVFTLVGTVGVIPFLLFFAVCLFLRTKQLSISIIIPLITIGIGVLSNYFIQLIFSFMFVEPLEVLLERDEIVSAISISSSLLMIALCLLAKYLFTKWKISNLLDRRYVPLIACFLFLTVVLFYFSILIIQQMGFTEENIRLSLLLFIVYTSLLFVVLIIMVRTTSRNIQIDSEKIQYQQLQQYIGELEIQHREIRKFRHDYMNILLTLTDYLEERDMEGLAYYLTEEIIPTGEKFQIDDYQLGILSNLGVSQVKSIICSKVIKAQGLNIRTIIDIPNSVDYLNTNLLNLCRALGIILDNAIEESQQCDHPILQIAILEKENQQLIIVKNSCRPNLPTTRQMFQDGFSTKGTNRGLGLSILQEIMNELKGVTLETTIEENKFIQKINITHQ